MVDHLVVLRERRNWLTARIAAKTQVGWDIEWDVRERDALTWALAECVPSCCSCELPAVGRYRVEDGALEVDLCAAHEETLPDEAYLLVDYESHA